MMFLIGAGVGVMAMGLLGVRWHTSGSHASCGKCQERRATLDKFVESVKATFR